MYFYSVFHTAAPLPTVLTTTTCCCCCVPVYAYYAHDFLVGAHTYMQYRACFFCWLSPWMGSRVLLCVSAGRRCLCVVLCDVHRVLGRTDFFRLLFLDFLPGHSIKICILFGRSCTSNGCMYDRMQERSNHIYFPPIGSAFHRMQEERSNPYSRRSGVLSAGRLTHSCVVVHTYDTYFEV